MISRALVGSAGGDQSSQAPCIATPSRRRRRPPGVAHCPPTPIAVAAIVEDHGPRAAARSSPARRTHWAILSAAELAGTELERTGVARSEGARRRQEGGGRQARGEAISAPNLASVAARASQNPGALPLSRDCLRHGGVDLPTSGTVSMILREIWRAQGQPAQHSIHG